VPAIGRAFFHHHQSCGTDPESGSDPAISDVSRAPSRFDQPKGARFESLAPRTRSARRGPIPAGLAGERMASTVGLGSCDGDYCSRFEEVARTLTGARLSKSLEGIARLGPDRPRKTSGVQRASASRIRALMSRSTMRRATLIALEIARASLRPCAMMTVPSTPRRGAPPYSE